MAEPAKVSPLGAGHGKGRHPNHEGAVGLTLSHRLPDALVQVQAWPDTIDAVRDALPGDAMAMATGPGRWLLDGDAGLVEALERAVPIDRGAVTDLTHARTVFRVEGERAAWLVAAGFPLDVHLGAWPVGETKLSRLHHDIGATIRRDGETAFELYVFTSFARSFQEWMETVAAEVGYEIA